MPPSRRPDGLDVFLDDHFSEAGLRAAGGFFGDVGWLFFEDSGLSSLAGASNCLVDVKKMSWLVSGIISLSDWIASNELLFDYIAPNYLLTDYFHEQALPKAQVAIARLGILMQSPITDTTFKAVFPDLKKLRPTQELIASLEDSTEQHLILIEDRTGSGKTEAALHLAHRHMARGHADGVFFGLPTMATANSMYDRIRETCERMFPDSRPSIVLAHSSKQMPGYLDGEESFDRLDPGQYPGSDCTAWLADNRNKALLGQIGVGTLDQALMSVLPLRYQSLRTIGLSRNTLIADEVHSYDPYTNALLCRLLEAQAAIGGSAILLSATVPVVMRDALVGAYCNGAGWREVSTESNAYPLVSILRSDALYELEVPCEEVKSEFSIQLHYSEEDIYPLIEAAAGSGSACCWIRNTVSDAMEAFDRLCSRIGEEQVMLFHSRFMMGDRLEIESDVLHMFGKGSTEESRKDRILVATQVVEQSLDLDFDFMVTDLAPVDLVIQRAGRLHRHTRDGSGNPYKHECRGQPTLHVLSPHPDDRPDGDWYKRMFPGGHYVYPETARLWLTARVLRKTDTVAFPRDARVLIEYVYGTDTDSRIPAQMEDAFWSAEGMLKADKALGLSSALDLRRGYDEEAGDWTADEGKVSTRLGSPSSDLILCKRTDRGIEPLYEDDDWLLSRASLSHASTNGPARMTPSLEDEEEAMPRRLRLLSRRNVPVIMRPAPMGWEGEVYSEEGSTTGVSYSRRRGLFTRR